MYKQICGFIFSFATWGTRIRCHIFMDTNNPWKTNSRSKLALGTVSWIQSIDYPIPISMPTFFHRECLWKDFNLNQLKNQKQWQNSLQASFFQYFLVISNKASRKNYHEIHTFSWERSSKVGPKKRSRRSSISYSTIMPPSLTVGRLN